MQQILGWNLLKMCYNTQLNNTYGVKLLQQTDVKKVTYNIILYVIVKSQSFVWKWYLPIKLNEKHYFIGYVNHI